MLRNKCFGYWAGEKPGMLTLHGRILGFEDLG
jgi:hypothetical protein